MAPNNFETFGTLFRKLRLHAGISTLKEFGELLSGKGYIYEDSIFSHWQNDTKIPRQRKVLIAVLTVLKEKNPYLTLQESNDLLTQAGHGYLTNYEYQLLHFDPSPCPKIIPSRIDYFTGREQELKEIAEDLSLHKIIQITGQAGIGKTSLAIEFAHRYPSLFPDGTLLYRFDTIDAPFILNHIAKLYGENIDDIRDLQLKNSFLSTLLKDKRILIILDNIEHNINNKNLFPLLIPTPGIYYILTTQQAYLNIDPTPALLKLKSFNKKDLQLMYEKIVLSTKSDQFIMLCKSYGCLPLIAASLAKKIHYLKTNKIPINIEDSVKNGDIFTYTDKNLYSFFDSIKTDLTTIENKVWTSTAIFNAQDFSENAIKHVNHLSFRQTRAALEKLYSLSVIEKSGYGRWRVHQSIKNYLLEFLDKDMYYELADYYISTFQRNENGYKKLYPKIEKEFNELRFLLQYLLDNNSLDYAVGIWTFFSIFLWDRGYWHLLREFGERLLKIASQKDYMNIVATIAIRDLTWLYIWQNEPLKAYNLLRNSKLENEVNANSTLLGMKYQELGFIFSQHRLSQKALSYLNMSKVIWTTLSDKHNYIKTIIYIGHSYENTSNLIKALTFYKKSLKLASKYEFVDIESKSHYYLGEIYKKLGKFRQAKEHFNEALMIDIMIRRRSGIGWNKHSLSEIAQAEGNTGLAEKLHREAHEAFLIVGVNPSLH